MRLITVPGDVAIEEKIVTFKEFMINAIDLYQPAGKSVKMLRQAAKIVDLIERSNGHLTLEDADYAVLKAAMHFEDGAGDWNPKVGRRVLSFFDAVEKAEEIKP